MSVSQETREYVRQRALFACEYCGVREQDAAGELTVDHVRPRSQSGTDDESNLVYCCPRCNQFKAAYWPSSESDVPLWNPREEPHERHFLALANGLLHPLTPAGAVTLKRLRLNRPPLVSLRRRRLTEMENSQLFKQYRMLLAFLERMQEQQALLLEEHHELLKQQRALIRLLLRIRD